mmetsp:Transcript_22823/g.29574  ORF Transcript_22823/g.29574 Transcript_22823/m.29574 type:complete len:91 (+) Transcript_22823:1013-1285(+)
MLPNLLIISKKKSLPPYEHHKGHHNEVTPSTSPTDDTNQIKFPFPNSDPLSILKKNDPTSSQISPNPVIDHHHSTSFNFNDETRLSPKKT